MNPIVMTIVATLGKVLLGLFTSLLTEKFLKKTIIAVLEKIVDRTQSDLDNKILSAAKEAWGEAGDAP